MVQAQDNLRNFGRVALTSLAQELRAEVAVFFAHDPVEHRLQLFRAMATGCPMTCPNPMP